MKRLARQLSLHTTYDNVTLPSVRRYDPHEPRDLSSREALPVPCVVAQLRLDVSGALTGSKRVYM